MGRQRMICLDTFCKILNITWIRRYVFNDACHLNWKDLLISIFSNILTFTIVGINLVYQLSKTCKFNCEKMFFVMF